MLYTILRGGTTLNRNLIGDLNAEITKRSKETKKQSRVIKIETCNGDFQVKEC